MTARVPSHNRDWHEHVILAAEAYKMPRTLRAIQSTRQANLTLRPKMIVGVRVTKAIHHSYDGRRNLD